eukprot:362897-Chlamydomonas_euryale.AAC.1
MDGWMDGWIYLLMGESQRVRALAGKAVVCPLEQGVAEERRGFSHTKNMCVWRGGGRGREAASPQKAALPHCQ